MTPKSRRRALVVEDELANRGLLERVLSERGYHVVACASGEEGWEACQTSLPPLLVLDWMLPGMDGLELCRRVRALPDGERSVVIVATARDGAEDLDAVLEAGADDYITKPLQLPLLRVRLTIAERRMDEHAERRRAEERLDLLRHQLDGRAALGDLVGRSRGMQLVFSLIRQLAGVDTTVLIEGDTGTGKELVARAIHQESHRARGPFLAVNCAGLNESLVASQLFGHRRGAFTGATADSPGYFRAADRGTLFLDEIGELPLELQPKLLRALETGRVTPVGATTPVATDVRVVAATHVDLRTAVADERFRMDLYARLAGFVVRVPALRHRRDDIPRLVRHLLRALAPGVSVGWEPQWMEALMLHGWPMNVRELRTVLQRAILLADDPGRLHASDLPEEVRTPAGGASGPTAAGGAPDTSLAPTRELLVHLLTLYRGNVVQIARHVGKNRTQVYRWLRRHDLAPDDYRDAEPASAEADPPE